MKNTKQTIRIEPQAAIQACNAEAAPAGVAAECINLRECDGALAVVGTPAVVGTAAADERLLIRDDERLLTLRGREVRCNGATVTTLTGDCAGACRLGRFIVLLTTEGRVYLLWRGTGYAVLNPSSAVPRLRLRAASLASHTVNIPAVTFTGEYTQWQAPLAPADVAAVSTAVNRAWDDALASARHDRRFTGPVLARYAVRLWDDSLLWASAPVLIGGELLATSRMAVAEVVQSGGRFTGADAATASFRSFAIEPEVLGGIDSDWHGLVKSVDVYATPAAPVVDLAATVSYRCAVSTSAGSRRYLLDTEPKAVSASTMVSVLTRSRWHLVASTTRLADLDRGVFSLDRVSASTSVPVAFFAAATAAAGHRQRGGCALAYNGLMYQAPAGRQLVNSWSPEQYGVRAADSGTQTAVVSAELATDHGAAVVTTQWTIDALDALGPLVAFPDSRAARLTVAVGNRVATFSLEPWHDAGLAFFVSDDLQNNALSTGTPPAVLNSGDIEPSTGVLEISRRANPFVVEQETAAAGSEILALGAALKPIYSGGYGRYPVYLFTREGIFVMPQSTSGTLGEPRLLAVSVPDTAVTPVMGGDSVWMVDTDGFLCSIKGAVVTRRCRPEALAAMAWNERYRELLMLESNGTLAAVEPSGRVSRRTAAVVSLYSDAACCLAIERDTGNILDMKDERPSGSVRISYLSQPVPLPQWHGRRLDSAEWNIFGENLDLSLELRAEQGGSCHGALVCRYNVRGVLNAPLPVRLLSHAPRTLRIAISGQAPSATLLQPTVLRLREP